MPKIKIYMDKKRRGKIRYNQRIPTFIVRRKKKPVRWKISEKRNVIKTKNFETLII